MKQWILSNSKKFWRIWLTVLLIGMTLVTLSFFLVDQKFAQYFGSPEMVQVWLFHRNITEIGEAGIYFAFALFALLIKKWRKKASFFLASMLSSGLALHLIKFSVGRIRPHKTPGHDPFVFEPFNFHHHFQSFPSGHSQTLFTIATFIAFLFPRSFLWIMPVALYLAFTRAITLAHFVSDVWAGALLGILITALCLRKLVQKYGP
jgi:membrane-associated phospholipid phosphatase